MRKCDLVEICKTLVEHTTEKEEVMTAMLKAFPGEESRKVRMIVHQAWKQKKTHVSVNLRNKSWTEKFNIVRSYYLMKDAGTAKSISFRLLSELAREIPIDDYITLIGKNNYIKSGRNRLRGKDVFLRGFTPDYMKIIVSETNESSEEYLFTLFDISALRNMKVIL